MSTPKTHHFIPRFYLRQWCSADDGRLNCFLIKGTSVKRLRLRPEGTGAENQLYALERVPTSKRAMVETAFFSAKIDGPASQVLRKLLESGARSLTREERMQWGVFLMALPARRPETIRRMKAEFAPLWAEKIDEKPEKYRALAEEKGFAETTLAEYLEKNEPGITAANAALLRILPGIIAHTDYLLPLVRMHWWVRDVSSANVDLVTCDRPMFFNTGLNKPGCLVMVPLSPDKVFFACNDRARLDAVEGCSANTLARSCNQDIVLLADKWVYGEAKDNFIANWLLKKAAGKSQAAKAAEDH